ncbi:oxidoreductase [Aureococcus anophagefferens]|nr:oxidoreductase [Aureococcus anophagefferens]
MSLDEALSLSLGSPRSAAGLPCAPPRRDGDGKKRAGVPMNLRVLDQQLKRSLDVALKYATPLEKALNARLDSLNGDADAREEFFKKIDYLKEKRQEARRNDPDVRRQRALAHRVAAESPRRTLAEKHASVRSNRESFHSKRSERILSAYVRKTARVVKTKAERLEDEQRARPWLAALVLARNAVDTKRSYDRRTRESDQYGGGRAVKGAASRVQNLWRRKTEVDRGRRYRDSRRRSRPTQGRKERFKFASTSYIAAKRTTMLMNRKGKAVDVIAHFLTENANARKHIHRVIKNLLKATRRVQRYWREFAVVSSHRLALLNMLWQDAETDYYRAAKARCHEVAEQRRVEIFAVGARSPTPRARAATSSGPAPRAAAPEDYLRKLLFECRRKFKVDLPDSTNLLANNAYAIAARLASIEDVRMLLRGGPGSRPATAASDDAGKEDVNSGAERIIGRLVANVRTKRRRRRVPDKRCWFRLFAHAGRDSIFDYVQECEADYATSADALKQQDVVAPLPARRSAQINKQGSVAMRRASRVIQAEALKAVGQG